MSDFEKKSVEEIIPLCKQCKLREAAPEDYVFCEKCRKDAEDKAGSSPEDSRTPQRVK